MELQRNYLVSALKRAVSRFSKAEIPVRAAALAFHTLLGIVPIVGIIFWYLHHINVTEHWLGVFRQFITAQLNVDSNAIFMKHFDRLTKTVRGGSWGMVGLVVFLYTGYNLIARFGQSLDIVIATATKPPKTEIHTARIAARRLAAMLLLPIAIIAALAITDWIRRDSWLNVVFTLPTVGAFIALPLAWVGEIIAVFLVYWLIPRANVAAKEAIKAAVIVAPSSELMRILFSIYNHHAVSTYKIYGVLAVIPLFFLWVQFSWMLLLSGALLLRFSDAPATAAVGAGRNRD